MYRGPTLALRSRCRFCEALGPGLVHRGRSVSRRGSDGVEREGRRGEDLRIAAAVVDEFAGGVGEADELGLREHGRRAVAELVVELAADHEDRVGLGHRRGAHGADRGRMIARHQAAALLGVEIDGAERVEQAHELGAGPAGAAARSPPAAASPTTARRPSARWSAGSGGMTRGGFGRHPFVEHEIAAPRGRAARRSESRDRPGPARRGRRTPGSRLRRTRESPDRRPAACARAAMTGRRMSTWGMSCSGPMLACARDVQPPITSTGHAGERGIRDRGRRVGDARTRGHHGDAEFAGEFGVRVRHVDRRDFVAHVDDADAELGRVIPDRLDVAALQAEDAVDAARLRESARSRPRKIHDRRSGH